MSKSKKHRDSFFSSNQIREETLEKGLEYFTTNNDIDLEFIISDCHDDLKKAQTRIDKVLSRYLSDNERLNKMVIEWQVVTTEKQHQIDELKETLLFYSNKENYYSQTVNAGCGCCSDIVESVVEQDEGTKARNVLEKK